MSEKHPDFEIQAVNTIRPQDIKYTKTFQPLVPVDKIVKSIETKVIYGLELLIQAQDLVKAYQTSTHF